MDKFTFSYPAKVYFGEGSAAQALDEELSKVGEVVMLAYGGGSIKKCCGETVPVIFSEFIIDFVFWLWYNKFGLIDDFYNLELMQYAC